MSDPKAIIFDLDGTLVHSAPDLHAAVNHVLEQIGRAPLDLASVTGFVGNGAQVLMQRVLAVTGGGDGQDLQAAMPLLMDAYARQGTQLSRLYPGVRDTLDALAARGIAMGVCTNKPHDMAVTVCREMGIADDLQMILGATEDRARKPDPAMLDHVISALGASRDTALYVGDSDVDCATAQAAQVQFRFFEGGYLNAPLPEPAPRPEHRFSVWTIAALLGAADSI